MFKPPTGFEDQGHHILKISGVKTSDNRQFVAADCWALLQKIDPDLAYLAQRWLTLPDHIKAAIYALLLASLSGERCHAA